MEYLLKDQESKKRKALDSMKVPNLENAKVIYSYLLEFKKAFDRGNHITMKTDLTGQGINVIKQFAEIAGVDAKLKEIPVIDKDIVKFATDSFIIHNSTSCKNGGIVIFTSKKISRDIIEDLRKAGMNPEIIGEV